jgi:dienelactone hydrolase
MRVLGLCLLVISALALNSTAAAAEGMSEAVLNGLRQEAGQRSQALVQQGFNLTHGLRLKAGGSQPQRLTLLLPPFDGERSLSLWVSVQGGDAQVTLTPAATEADKGAATALLSWSARHGETSLQRRLAPGRYDLELDARATAGGVALLTIKGPALVLPTLDAARVQQVAAAPTQGFHWPYYLYLPKQIKSPHLLVVPNNSGFVSEDLELLRAASALELNRQSAMAERLGVALLVPMFPRPLDPVDAEAENLYLHALSRAAMQTQRPEWRRVDKQLLAMIDDARQRLAGQGQDLAPQVLMSGFSASGMFVNRFAFMHPERVLALASGSPGGWPLAPQAQHKGAALNYPVGVADWTALTGEPLRLAALRSVAAFIYMGEQDDNDSVVHRDSYSATAEKLIFAHFGATPLARWQAIQRLYTEQGLDARFTLYPGEAHRVTEQMDADIAAFFAQRLAKAAPTKP